MNIKDKNEDTMQDFRELTTKVDLDEIFAECGVVAEATVQNLHQVAKEKGLPLEEVKMHESSVFEMAYIEYALSVGLEDNQLLRENLSIALRMRQ